MSRTLTEELVREHVCRCLMKIKRDEAYMEGANLHGTDYSVIKDEKDPDKQKIDDFLDYVAISLKTSKKAKRAKGKLKEMLGIIKRQIEEFDPETYGQNSAIQNGGSAAARSLNGAVKSEAGEGNDQDVGSGTKKRPRSPSGDDGKKKKKSRKSFTFKPKERKKYSEQAKAEYEAERAEIEEKIDANYKKHWGAIAFAKWKKDPYRPVVLLGPYAVPVPLRETWKKMYENTKGDPERLWYYCFWYGSPLNEAYSTVTLKDVILYDAAKRRGIHQLDKKIQAKKDAGKKLNKTELQVYTGFQELEKELLKKPEERVPEMFREDHEALLDMEDNISLEGEDSIASNDSQVETSDSESENDEEEKEAEVTPPKKATKKKEKLIQLDPPQKSSKKKEKTTDVKPTKKAPKKNEKAIPVVPKKTPGKQEGKVKKVAVVDPSSDLSEAEYSDDDAKDENFEKSDHDDNNADTDVDDQEFKAVVATPTKKSKKVQATKGNLVVPGEAPEKVKSAKKELKKEAAVTEARDLEREEKNAKRRERDRLLKKRKEEGKAYDLCVEKFGKAIKALGKSINKKDGAKAVKIVLAIKGRNLDLLTAPFIEDVKLPGMVRSMKQIMETEDEKKQRKEFLEDLKRIYLDKKDKLVGGDWRQYSKLSIEPQESEDPEQPSMKKGMTYSGTKEEGDAGKKQSEIKESDKTDLADAKESGKPDEMQREDSTMDGVDSEVKIAENGSGLDTSRHSSGGLATAPLSTKAGLKRSHSLDATKGAAMKSELKPKRKKFSLQNVLNMDSKQKEKCEENTPARKSTAPGEVIPQALPQWLTEEVSQNADESLDEMRQMALEFFDELGACYFPEAICRPSFAMSFEKATKAWTDAFVKSPAGIMKLADEDNTWESIYWERLHLVVGSISGKRKPGNLLTDILSGKVSSAEEVVNLPESALLGSYEGSNNGFY